MDTAYVRMTKHHPASVGMMEIDLGTPRRALCTTGGHVDSLKVGPENRTNLTGYSKRRARKVGQPAFANDDLLSLSSWRSNRFASRSGLRSRRIPW